MPDLSPKALDALDVRLRLPIEMNTKRDYCETGVAEDCMETAADTIAALRAELTAAREEIGRLRKIAAHVPGMVYIKAKENAGFGVEVKANES